MRTVRHADRHQLGRDATEQREDDTGNETVTLIGQLAEILTPVALVTAWILIDKRIRSEGAQVRREAEKAHAQIGQRIGRVEQDVQGIGKKVDGVITEIGNVKHALGRLEGAQGVGPKSLEGP